MSMIRTLLLALAFIAQMLGAEAAKKMPFKLTSPAVADGAALPEAYSAEKDNRPLPLKWSDAPKDAKSFVIILDDPDAVRVAGKTVVHWFVVNIPASSTEVGQKGSPLPAEAKELDTDMGSGYVGPCPPRGQTHTYVAHVFALSGSVAPDAAMTGKEFEKKFAKSIVGHAQLKCTYRGR